MALREKMSAIGTTEQNEGITKLSPMNFGSSGIMNDFEKIMSELGGGTFSDDFVSTLRFGRHRADVHWTSCAPHFSLIRVHNALWEDIT